METKNETEIMELEIIPAKANFSIEEVVATVVAEVERYNQIVVTRDTLAIVKKDCTHINKSVTFYDRTRIDGMKKATEPLKPIEEALKKCASMLNIARLELLEKIDAIEVKDREGTRVAMEAYLKMMVEKHELRDEFNTVGFDDIIKKAGNLTTTGNLLKPSKDEIESRVQACLVIQKEKLRRFDELPKYCHDRGLSVPLSLHSLNHIIDFEIAEYYDALNGLIDGELQRQKDIQDKADAKAKADAIAQKIADDANKALEAEKLENEQKAQKKDSEDGRGSLIDVSPIEPDTLKPDVSALGEADAKVAKTDDVEPDEVECIVNITMSVRVAREILNQIGDTKQFEEAVGQETVRVLLGAGVKNIIDYKTTLQI